jgi:hypothetical protein
VRYIKVTHSYVIPVPEDEEPGELDAICNAGVSMMENKMQGFGKAMIDLKSDWQLMPKEFHPQEEAEISFTQGKALSRSELMEIMQGRFDQMMDSGQVSFTQDLMQQKMKVPHPWDQGLRIFPPDDDMGAAETEALRQEHMICGHIEANYVCVGVRGHEGHGLAHNMVPLSEVPQLRSGL